MSATLLAWAGLLVVLGLWTLGAHNRVTALRAAILAAWTQVEAVLQSRGQALAALLAAAAQPLAGEAAALEAVAAAQAQVQAATDLLRRTPVDQHAVAELSKADAVLAAVLVRLVFARQVFNQAGAAYHHATGQVPPRLLHALLRFKQAGRL